MKKVLESLGFEDAHDLALVLERPRWMGVGRWAVVVMVFLIFCDV